MFTITIVAKFHILSTSLTCRYSDGNNYKEVDLCLLVKEDNYHYVWIKDFGTFMCHYNNNKHKKYPCRRCLRILSTPEIRREHIKLCKGVNTGAQQINMPDEGTNLRYQFIFPRWL